MKTQKYEKLYSLSVDDFVLLDDKTKNDFIFQGSKNWDMYCEGNGNIENFESFEDVLLLDFDNQEKFNQYISNHKIIDYSIEHISELNKYFVLVDNNV